MSDLNLDTVRIPEPGPEAPPPDPIDTLAGELAEAFPPGGDPAAPSAATERAPAGELLDEATVRMFLQVPFDFIAARKGAHWKLTAEELAVAVPLTVKVSNKYAPELLKRWADEIALAVVLGMIFLKRVNLDSQEASNKAHEKAAAEAAAA